MNFSVPSSHFLSESLLLKKKKKKPCYVVQKGPNPKYQQTGKLSATNIEQMTGYMTTHTS